MRVADLVENIPTVRGDDLLLDAAKTLLRQRLTALVVVDDAGRPSRIVPATQVLWALIPQYMRDDEALSHVLDEEGADEYADRLRNRTVAQLLTEDEVTVRELPVVKPEDTLVEAAYTFARSRSPVVLVKSNDQTYHGVITASRTIAAAVALAGDGDDPAVRRRLTTDLLPETDH